MSHVRCSPSTERSRLIDQYNTILRLTRHMLQLSRDHEWEQLIAIETEYMTAVSQLGDPLPVEQLDEATRARIGELLEAILENDILLRQQLIERRDALGEMLQVSQCQQDLHRTYSGGKVVNARSRFRRKPS